MSLTSSGCCSAVLNQQHEQNISYHKQCQENHCQEELVNHNKSTVKNCTVVENGRVVVKTIQTPLEE